MLMGSICGTARYATFRRAFIRGVDGEPIGPQAGSCGTAAFRREPVIVEDIAKDPLVGRLS